MEKGHKRTSKRGSNKGNDNIISNGSIMKDLQLQVQTGIFGTETGMINLQ
ncbi:hypothetical protein ABH966_003346 [Lysinibacillus sp. RC46]